MWVHILQALYLFLPAYAATMAPVLAKRFNLLPSLAWPIDRGSLFRDQPLLGPHKTFRGIVVGLLAAIGVAALQQAVSQRSSFFFSLSTEPQWLSSPLLWGSALGGGALLGDLVKSFIKRRFGIPPGQRWFPWDQLDQAIGGVLVGSLLYPFPWITILIILLATPLLSLIINISGYVLSLKEAW
ncbi:MAG: CDP-archaeol synthase [bacterium]|nr:CDP-archaeol synthase [bacterium]